MFLGLNDLANVLCDERCSFLLFQFFVSLSYFLFLHSHLVSVGFTDPGKQILRYDWPATLRSGNEQIFQTVSVCVVFFEEIAAGFTHVLGFLI